LIQPQVVNPGTTDGIRDVQVIPDLLVWSTLIV
jgi:hypothetical protein